MKGFINKLILAPHEDGRTWVLVKPLFFVLNEEESYTVPKGFRTDLASVPRPLWSVFPRWGKYGRAAVLHDYLYETKKVSKKQADKLFLKAMECDKVPLWKRTAMYYAVSVFGGRDIKGKLGLSSNRRRE